MREVSGAFLIAKKRDAYGVLAQRTPMPALRVSGVTFSLR